MHRWIRRRSAVHKCHTTISWNSYACQINCILGKTRLIWRTSFAFYGRQEALRWESSQFWTFGNFVEKQEKTFKNVFLLLFFDSFPFFREEMEDTKNVKVENFRGFLSYKNRGMMNFIFCCIFFISS